MKKAVRAWTWVNAKGELILSEEGWPQFCRTRIEAESLAESNEYVAECTVTIEWV